MALTVVCEKLAVPRDLALLMTKREFFAALAMHGMLAAGMYSHDATRAAPMAADSLIEELAGKPT